MTDTDLINFLENKNKEKNYTGHCIFRMSKTGRGWRLYETSKDDAKSTVREAIVDAILKGRCEVEKQDILVGQFNVQASRDGLWLHTPKIDGIQYSINLTGDNAKRMILELWQRLFNRKQVDKS